MRSRLVLIIIAMIASASLIGWFVYDSGYPWPTEKILSKQLGLTASTEITDHHGATLGYIVNDFLHLPVKLSQISPSLITFVVASEDSKFFSHKGFDMTEIKKSFEKNIEKRRFARGGSTISQQVVKNLFLDQNKNIMRKLFEVPWTKKLEAQLSKNEILNIYLNSIEWGPGLRGIEAASRHFFDKNALQLTQAESLYLTMIIPNPNRFDLFNNPNRTDFLVNKRNQFIGRLIAEKTLDPHIGNQLMLEPYGLRDLNLPNPRFPLCHWGTYTSHCIKQSKAHQELLLKNIIKFKSKKQTIQTSLDKTLFEELQHLELTADPTHSSNTERYVIASPMNSQEILAFRLLPTGKTLLPVEFLSLDTEFQLIESNQFPWQDLIKNKQ